jgi:ubiquinone/menaquinone biosynthesis C-methylase UbiE
MDFKNNKIDEVIEANKILHSKMAPEYNSCEPHFSPENVLNVELRINNYWNSQNNKKALDLGCGTGFMINILKKNFKHITGVDVTQEMLDRVDMSGNCEIQLMNCDTGKVELEHQSYDLVTAYSFLHHLYDPKPTFETAYKSLKDNGVFYADLDPNFYFWEKIHSLDFEQDYDPVIEREIKSVSFNDLEIKKRFMVSEDIFNTAEFGKNIKGGFRDFDLVRLLKEVGFKEIKVFFNWFIGQSYLINKEVTKKEELLNVAKEMEEVLHKVLPISKSLFKYIGFCATK